MLAFIGNLDFLEILVITAAAIMVFGKNLPKVAMRGAAQLMKLRREVTRMWREAGLEEELRKVRRDLDQLPAKLPTADELIQYEEQQEHLEGSMDASPEDVGAVAPIDPLSREALAGEPAEPAAPGEPAEPVEPVEIEPAPGAEDALDDPTLVGRTEPTGEEEDHEIHEAPGVETSPGEDVEKESA